MVMTASAMVELGTKAPDFSLPDVRDGTVSLSDFDDAKALLVVFMGCNIKWKAGNEPDYV